MTKTKPKTRRKKPAAKRTSGSRPPAPPPAETRAPEEAVAIRRGGDLPDTCLRMEELVEYLRRNWADGFPGIIRADNARRVEVAKALTDMHCPGCDRYGTLILGIDRPALRCRVCGRQLTFGEAVSERFRGRSG